MLCCCILCSAMSSLYYFLSIDTAHGHVGEIHQLPDSVHDRHLNCICTLFYQHTCMHELENRCMDMFGYGLMGAKILGRKCFLGKRLVFRGETTVGEINFPF